MSPSTCTDEARDLFRVLDLRPQSGGRHEYREPRSKPGIQKVYGFASTCRTISRRVLITPSFSILPLILLWALSR